MKINDYFKNSVGGSKENFKKFLEANNPNIDESDFEQVDNLAQKIAQNMLYFEDNINTAKSDYITLLGILMKKGLIFKDE